MRSCAPSCVPAQRLAIRRSAAASASMSSSYPPIRPGRCMSGTAAARWSGTRWPALLAKAGFSVQREYYINDAGAQVDILARSAYLRYREALGEAIGPIPEGLISRRISRRNRPALAERDGRKWLGRPEAEWLGRFATSPSSR